MEISDLSPTPSEAHGMLCGFICISHDDPEHILFDHLYPEPFPTEEEQAAAREPLHALAVATIEQFESPEMTFAPLLPGEHTPLAERAVALYDWIRGFLYVLGIEKVSTHQFSPQVREAIRDFTDVTHMDLNDLEDSEDNERALTELVEFIRAATLLIHAEAHRTNTAAQ